MFRFRPPRAVAFVDLRGEATDWLRPCPMALAGDGTLGASLRLGPGTYAYKFRLADGEWCLDPANPRTRAWDGVRNSLLVVDGADEPVLHAPVRPYAYVEDDGRLRIGAGLRRGHGETLALAWDEGRGPRRTLMRVVAAEDEHMLLAAHLPVSAAEVEYRFEVGEGARVGTSVPFRVRPADLRPDVPAWWRGAVVCTVLVDRYRPGGRAGEWPPGVLAIADDRRAGGDLDGVAEALPHLADLGVTVLHLTPLATSPSAHRYDATDPDAVDPSLGGEDAFRRLLDRARGAGLRVLVDVTLTHVHRDCPEFADVRARGPASRFWEWFRPTRWPFSEGEDPGYEHYQKRRWAEPLLRLDNPEVAERLARTAAGWVARGADGLRLDAAADVPEAVLAGIRQAVRAVSRDAVLLGEVISAHAWRWTAGALDAATDFVAQQALYDWALRRSGDAASIADRLARRAFWRGGPACTSVRFAGTHDQPRFRTLARDPAAARLALLEVLTGPAVPLMLYGDEVGLTGGDGGGDFEDVWPERRCMPWDPAAWDVATLALVRSAARIRREVPALAGGEAEYLAPAPDVLVVRRRHGDDVADVLLHRGDGVADVALPGGAPGGAEVLLALGDATVGAGRARLGPWAGLVLRRVPPPDVARAWAVVRARNAELALAAWRDGRVEVASLPVRLDVVVTEACNLRCRHCINHSPERTRNGVARALRPWLVGRMREALAAADRLSMTHGGESLVEPALWDLLAAYAAARKDAGGAPAGRRSDVHLLSNGMLLDGDTVARLAEAGVTSVGVSLDGATAATNDAIREGGSLDRVVANLAGAVRRRASSGADLRIGVSAVACASNVAELPDLGRLVADLGLDWLKVEEAVPATGFARGEALSPRDPRLADAMADLRARSATGAFVLVDHLAPPAGCACLSASRPGLEEFLAADAFANRAGANPCRAAWEHACIEPDGALRPGDWERPVAASLADVPFPEAWNAAEMQEERLLALSRVSWDVRSRCGRRGCGEASAAAAPGPATRP